MLSDFSAGFLSTDFPMSLCFLGGFVVGASLWLLTATRLGLPVSTTHTLLGGVVSVALAVSGPQGLRAKAIANEALGPLLVSSDHHPAQ